jgi:phosphofructokinase-like protein
VERIGIITAGGDCAGLNAVIASIVKAGTPLGYQFVGFERGWEGILNPPMYKELDLAAVSGITHLGGTILRTTNRGRFSSKKGAGEVNEIPREILEEAKHNLDSLNISGLMVIGGDGSLGSALQLAKVGVNVVGVPKTIDNDLHSTDQTFGFSTAVQVAVDALDKIHTTASSHDRTIFVECMGRNAGWIALFAGLAGGADSILLPEFPFELTSFVEHLRSRTQSGKTSNIVVVAEGVRFGNAAHGKDMGSTQEALLGGISERLMHAVEEMAPDEFEMRNVVLGHTQRGGTPNAEDRNLSQRYGTAAIEAYHQGKFNHMVALHGRSMQVVPIEDAVSTIKAITEESEELQTARKLGIFIC